MKRLTNSRLAVCAVMLFVGLALVPMAFGSEIEATCQNSPTTSITSSSCPGTAIPNPPSRVGAAPPAPFTATITETGATGGVPNLITLPFQAFGGDVLMNEPGSSALSDVVQFNSGIQNFGNQVFEYSDVEIGGPPDPNDVPVPPGFTPSVNAVTFTEVGTEGNNGLIYTVLNSDGTKNAVYTIVSDHAPEPGTLSLLSLVGLGGLAWLRRRGRKV